MTEQAKEYRLVPEYVEEFFIRAFTKAGGKVRRKDGFLAIESIPVEIREIAESVDFKNRYGILMKNYPKATFDKELAFKNPVAEFISFGHPLFEALLEWVMRKFGEEVRKGAVFKDPSGRLNGFIHFYIGEIKDGKGEVAGRRIIAVYDGEKVGEINPAVLCDLKPDSAEVEEIPDKDKVIPYVLEILEKYCEEIAMERERQAEIKIKYGLKSLDYLIGQLDVDLAELYERQGRGEKVDLPIRNKEEQKRRYEEAMERLKKEIELERSLLITMPEMLTVIKVIPDKSDMVESEEIERIGMEIAMEYERRNGREPEDVSKENLGFDIRSKGVGEIRYIEVKAKAEEGDIALTPNEWLKARRFGKDYWLYVVANALKNPKLYLIRNPTENLEVQEVVEIVRYIVPKEQWRSKGILEIAKN